MRPSKVRSRLCLALLAALLAHFQPSPVAVSNFTFYVDINSSATSNCTPTSSASCTGQCLSPTCGTQAVPCQKIQDAINIANCTIGTDTSLEADVLVAAGTYPQRASLYPNIHLIGAGRDVTTIDAKGLNRSAVIMAMFGNFGFNRPEVKFSISGFRIIHGSGDLITLRDSAGNLYYNIGGGGMLLFGEINTPGWPRVTDCRIEDNTLANLGGTAPDWNGAGIYIARGKPIISGNLIQRNTTTPPDQSGQISALGWGAGIFALNFDTEPLITHNIIRNNVTVAQLGNGGGMYISGNTATILSNNLVVANSANIEGGGIYIYSAGISAYNNLVMGNIGGGAGGGVDMGGPIAALNVTNNTIVGNVLTVHTVPKGATFSSIGGGVYSSAILSQQSSPINHLTNNLVAQNDATTLGGGGGLYSYQAFATNDHNDYYGDIPNEIRGDYSDASVLGSNGNVSLNPVFANAPVFWDHTNTAGTSSTAVVFDSTRYVVGNRIEYNDDGVARQITAINTPTKTLTFTPALSNTVCSNAVNAACATSADCLSPGTCVTATTQASRILANWGNNTIVTEDLRLTGSSPLLDAGTNTPLFGTVPTVDYDDFPRPADGDQNGSPIVDIGAFEFHLPDGDGDGVPDSLDCAPTVNSVWTVPDQVPAPLAIAVGQVLSWMHVPQANVYDVYSGTITTPFTFGPACLITEVPGLSASIAGSNPPVGSAYYYLVGGVNTCGSGPIHSFSTVFPPSACTPSGAQTDGDGILDINDNCPTVYNVNQADSDHDTVGTACDDCPSLYNPSQLDVNANGVGDDCEDVDGDGYPLVNDCNDGNPAIHPGATEVCNGLDDNCVNGVDEGGASLCVDANVCTQDVCGGTLGCQHPPVADGTTCDDASLCTPTDSCQSGVCVGGNPVICTSPDACHDPGTCAPATGVCSPPTPKPDGTACDDGNACTAPDTCQSGTCQPGGPRDADSDGHPDPLCGGNDCNDLNPLVWAAPAEVTNLILTTVSPANPAWDSQASLAGPETVYDLVSGSMGPGSGLNFAGGSCLLAEGPNSYSDSRPDPALGTSYWYLSRAENSCGVGTYGTPSRDSGILACP